MKTNSLETMYYAVTCIGSAIILIGVIIIALQSKKIIKMSQ